MQFFAVRGAFFKLFSIGSERLARCLCAPGALHFSRLLHLVFLQERSEHLKLKKQQLWAEKHPTSFAFFSIVQSNEWRGGPSIFFPAH